MTERNALVRFIAANPNDDTPRLVFADWLDEHGEHARAELIRVQIELEPFRNRYGGRRATELRQREHQLGQDHSWLWDMPRGWDDPKTGLSLRLRRGFPDLLRGPARSLLLLGAAVRALQPTIRRVVLHRLTGWGERLAACAGLDGLAELELACWYPDADLEALAHSPHLAALQVLVLWIGRREGVRDEDLCRIAVGARAWPKLRELVLFDPVGASQQEIEPLVAAANRQVGWEIARYERGDSERLPFGGSLGWGFLLAGWLPDGRAAVAELEVDLYAEPDTIPCGLVVHMFGGGGAGIGEVIRVPLPPEMANVAWSKADNRDGRYTRFLRDAIGFEPGLVRVPPSALGDRLSLDGFFESWGRCGCPDLLQDPDADDSRWVNGFGGELYGYLRAEELILSSRTGAGKGEEGEDRQHGPEPPPPEDDAQAEDEIPF